MSRHTIYISDDDFQTLEKMKRIDDAIVEVVGKSSVSEVMRYAIRHCRMPEQEVTSEQP